MINVEASLMSLLCGHLGRLPLDIPIAWNYRKFNPNSPGSLYTSSVAQVIAARVPKTPSVTSGDVVEAVVSTFQVRETAESGDSLHDVISRIADLWPSGGGQCVPVDGSTFVDFQLTAPTNGSVYAPSVSVIRGGAVLVQSTPIEATRAKVAAAYLVPHLLTGAHAPSGVGAASMDRSWGIFQVSVKVLNADGWAVDRAIVDCVCAHFKRSLRLSQGVMTVVVEASWPAATIDEGSGWTMTPVSIRYRLDAPNK